MKKSRPIPKIETPGKGHTGPITTYHIDPAEIIAKYGPVKKTKKGVIF